MVKNYLQNLQVCQISQGVRNSSIKFIIIQQPGWWQNIGHRRSALSWRMSHHIDESSLHPICQCMIKLTGGWRCSEEHLVFLHPVHLEWNQKWNCYWDVCTWKKSKTVLRDTVLKLKKPYTRNQVAQKSNMYIFFVKENRIARGENKEVKYLHVHNAW